MAGKRKRKTRDDDVLQIIEFLAREYQPFHPQAKVDAYRENSVSIRVQIIDPDFRGKNRVDRDGPISRLLAQLPESIESQITILLLITPEETKTSFANMDFEDPVPSML